MGEPLSLSRSVSASLWQVQFATKENWSYKKLLTTQSVDCLRNLIMIYGKRLQF